MVLEIRAYEIRGKHPVYQVGDQMVINRPRILVDRTNTICVHALSTLLHYVVALDEGADPIKLGLSKDNEYAYMHCIDLGESYIQGGNVAFKYRRMEEEPSK